MPHILIIDATDYIGYPLTPSLHLSSAPAVTASILGDISSSAILRTAITKHHIDIVVDVAGANQESFQATGAAGVRVPKLGFIYCSGMWVHGSSDEPVNDLMPVGTRNSPTPPPEIVSWRPALEQAILASSSILDVLIIRPAFVYGRSCSIWSALFELIHAAMQGAAPTTNIPIDPESRPGLVHVDDVAAGFHCAVDKLPLLAWTGVYPVFDLVTSQESMRDVLSGVGRAMGFQGNVKLVGDGGDIWMRGLGASCDGCSGRAKTILGWEPKRVGMLGGVDIWAAAWIASQE